MYLAVAVTCNHPGNFWPHSFFHMFWTLGFVLLLLQLTSQFLISILTILMPYATIFFVYHEVVYTHNIWYITRYMALTIVIVSDISCLNAYNLS